MKEDKWPEAFILAAYAGPDYTKRVQDKYFNVSHIGASLVPSNLKQLLKFVINERRNPRMNQEK